MDAFKKIIIILVIFMVFALCECSLEFYWPSINCRRNHSFISCDWFLYFFFKMKLNLYFSDYKSNVCSLQQIKKIKEHIFKKWVPPIILTLRGNNCSVLESNTVCALGTSGGALPALIYMRGSGVGLCTAHAGRFCTHAYVNMCFCVILKMCSCCLNPLFSV